MGIGTRHFGSGLVGGEHPVDSSAALVSLRLPDVDLGNEPVAAFDAAIETLAFEHADLDLNHVEPAGVLRCVVELKPSERAARFGRWECGVESGSGVGGEVVEDDADALGLWEVDIDELAHAKGEVVSGAMISDLDPAPRAMGIEEDEEIDGAVAAIFVVEALEPSGCGRDRPARFADELGGAFVEADHRPLRVRLLGIEVEHILHPGDVLGVDLGDAPHVLLPRLEMVLGQASADGLTRETVMVGQLDHRPSQQLQRPAGATFGRARTGGGDEEGFFVAGQLTIGACPRLLVQGGFEIAFNEAALGPVNGRAADSDSSGNIVVAETAVGGEQNLGSLDLAGVMLAAAHQRGEFAPLGFAQVDMIAYVHPGLIANRDAQTNQTMNQLFGTCPRYPRLPKSKVSTWPSSTPTAVSSANRPRKLTCSGTSKSHHPASIRWCSPSNAPAS